jgi:hypothetical protein
MKLTLRGEVVVATLVVAGAWLSVRALAHLLTWIDGLN